MAAGGGGAKITTREGALVNIEVHLFINFNMELKCGHDSLATGDYTMHGTLMIPFKIKTLTNYR